MKLPSIDNRHQKSIIDYCILEESLTGAEFQRENKGVINKLSALDQFMNDQNDYPIYYDFITNSSVEMLNSRRE